MAHKHCNHDHKHGHHHHIDPRELTGKKLIWAVAVNIGLTFVQIIAGILSGSLALIADALHNFSDAASLFIALIAFRIAGKPADHKRTFGYKRVETIAALVNLTALILLGLYLMTEAIMRWFSPQPVEGWTVVIVAGIALVIDAGTAFLMHKDSKTSLNIRAAYLHNLADALSSVAVIICGILIIVFQWYWIDAAMTLAISAYVMLLAAREFPPVINILMNGAPDHISIADVEDVIKSVDGVKGIHHVHLWRLDESRNATEAHVVLSDISNRDAVRGRIKSALKQQLGLDHVSLECEAEECGIPCADIQSHKHG